MKVLHIIPYDHFENPLNQAIITARSFKVEVIIPPGLNHHPLLQKHNIPYHVHQPSPTFAREILNIKNIIKQHAPDIVHTHNCFTTKAGAAMSAAGTKVHSQHVPIPPLGLKKIIGGKNTFYIAGSNEIYKSLAGSYRNIRTIYPAVPTAPKFSATKIAQLRARVSIKKDNFVVTAIDSNDWIGETIEEQPLNVTLFVAGDVLDIQLDIGEVIAISDGFIYTDNHEDIIYQSLSAGKPTIAIKGTHQIALSTSTLPIEADALALDDAITRLRTDKNLYAKLAQNAIDNHRRHFSASKVLKEITEIYKGAISK